MSTDIPLKEDEQSYPEDAYNEIDHSKNLAKTKRPINSAYTQQNLSTWVPIITAKDAIITFLVVGGIYSILGAVFFSAAESVLEYEVHDYGTLCMSASPCTVQIAIGKPMKGPVYIYYGLTNYYQNYRRYVKSVDYYQLSGHTEETGSTCAPLDFEGDVPYAPCGLIANSFFNDTLDEIVPANADTPIVLSATNIAWNSDIGKKFKNPASFDGTLQPYYWQFNITNLPSNSTPDIGYAYENQDFVNWMRTMALPSFRKLWRWINIDTLAAGTYNITINSSYPWNGEVGQKKLIFSTTTWLGGKNYFLGIAYLCFGGLYCILAIFFACRQAARPRRLADPQFLRWNYERRQQAST